MKKILIVDDEESVLLLLSKALKSDNVETITATKIEEAEYALNHTFFDLVIADIRLTGILGREGLELLEYIQEKSPGTKVIIMTAYGSKEIEKEAYDKGAYFYFDKPIDLRILNDHLKKLGIVSNLATMSQT
ncbi:MAG: response regulator [Deltaproteobacteria bacterium]|nr:MAG: response regulator [Deltaproteobacteria bacterium]